jgi:hypothetical protein
LGVFRIPSGKKEKIFKKALGLFRFGAGHQQGPTKPVPGLVKEIGRSTPREPGNPEREVPGLNLLQEGLDTGTGPAQPFYLFIPEFFIHKNP